MFIRRSRSLNDALLLAMMSIAARERLLAVSVVSGTPATFGARLSRFRMETLFCYGYLEFAMAERISRASCKFCQDEGRDSLEEMMKAGIMNAKQLDKDMDWREGTADRHFRNHM